MKMNMHKKVKIRKGQVLDVGKNNNKINIKQIDKMKIYLFYGII